MTKHTQHTTCWVCLDAKAALSDQTSPDGAAFSNLVAGDYYEVFVKYDSTPNLTNSVVYQKRQLQEYSLLVASE